MGLSNPVRGIDVCPLFVLSVNNKDIVMGSYPNKESYCVLKTFVGNWNRPQSVNFKEGEEKQ
jgi:hypothetical protein